MTKTVIEKIASSFSEVAVFKVVGTLGYHENKTLQKFFDECTKRGINRIVLDFSSLSSLGGGCASIIKQAASNGKTSLSIAGASKTVARFLDAKKDSAPLILAETVDEAVEKLKAASTNAVSGNGQGDDSKPGSDGAAAQAAMGEDESKQAGGEVGAEAGRKQDEEAVSGGGGHSPRPYGGEEGIPKVIILGSGDDGGTEQAESTVGGRGSGDAVENEVRADDSPGEVSREKDLKRKLFHYNTLLTIGSDFNKINDRVSLIDAFLLTTIAQIGVESAAFFEEGEEGFVLAASKGFDEDEVKWPQIARDSVDIGMWSGGSSGYSVDDLGIDEDLKNRLKSCNVEYAAPFVIQENLRGIVFLGKPIKRELRGDWVDFLKILMNQAAISYEKTRRLEEESERTLGLVQTLISLIEENTMGKGNTDLVAGYTYAVATRMNYPKEYLKDLMFGAVLRDIGMIKVSDLIVRSPRELVQEEWEIIKRHPSDGAEMLRTMKFSEHTTTIVLCHHERFNGEGYPAGMEGSGIPLGARIVSVVESYAAMLRDRPNRPALKEEEALNTLKENWGMRYDPDVVKNFLALKEEEKRSGKKMRFSHSELFKG